MRWACASRIDDAGAGYASMRHILSIEPNLVKLDISLTRGIDGDRKRRALASALIAFARETDVGIVAEGVETSAELLALQSLGVKRAQGYYLARPKPLAEMPGAITVAPTVAAPPPQLKHEVLAGNFAAGTSQCFQRHF